MPWKRKLSRSLRNPYREALDRARLYLVLDTEVQNYDSLFEIAKQAVTGGVDIVQLRDKKGSAKDILKFSEKILEFLNENNVSLRGGTFYSDDEAIYSKKIASPKKQVPTLDALGRNPDQSIGTRNDTNILVDRVLKPIPFILNDRVDLGLTCGTSGVHLGQEDLTVSFARKLMGPQAIIGASCQNLEQAKRAEREGADYIGFGSVFKTKTKPQRLPMDLKLLEEVIRKIKIPVFAIGGIDQHNVLTLRSKGIKRIAVCRAVCEAGDVPGAVKSLVKVLGYSG